MVFNIELYTLNHRTVRTLSSGLLFRVFLAACALRWSFRPTNQCATCTSCSCFAKPSKMITWTLDKCKHQTILESVLTGQWGMSLVEPHETPGNYRHLTEARPEATLAAQIQSNLARCILMRSNQTGKAMDSSAAARPSSTAIV